MVALKFLCWLGLHKWWTALDPHGRPGIEDIMLRCRRCGVYGRGRYKTAWEAWSSRKNDRPAARPGGEGEGSI